jgi:glycosyltransferase involved in cell wall biosynthesis
VSSIRVAVDATPLLGARTGIGQYVAHLLGELALDPNAHVRAAAFSLRGRSGLRDLPAGVRVVHRPVPARLLNQAWRRWDWPSAELVVGRVDVVHGTNFTLPPPRRAAAVVTVHDLAFVQYPDLVSAASLEYRELVPRGLTRAAAVLTPTQAVAAEVVDTYSVPPDRIWVTPMGVDDAWFSAIAARPPGLPEQYLLAVGTHEPRKGLDVLLSAYRLLLADRVDVPPLVIAGGTGWGPVLNTAQLTDDQVITLGYVDRPQLRGLVAGASLLAFPSLYEGFGLPPLEAMAAGTPVVATDVPAVHEVVGSLARLVPPRDAAALADALLDVLAHPPSADQRAAARERASLFTWRRCREATMAAYLSVTGGIDRR